MDAIFLDIETTGLDSMKHRAIDIAFQVVDVSKGTYKGIYQSIIKQPKETWDNRDPASIEINGFTWEQVGSGKEAKQVGQEVIALLKDLGIQRGKAVFLCQNPAFDRAFFTQLVDIYTQESLQWPYHWLDFASMYWALLVEKTIREGKVFPDQMSLSKNDIAKAHQLPEEQKPHRALNGVQHLIMCYEKVLGVKFEKR